MNRYLLIGICLAVIIGISTFATVLYRNSMNTKPGDGGHMMSNEPDSSNKPIAQSHRSYSP